MRQIPINEITGQEVLARDLVNEAGIILMVRGTVVKREYIERLRLLNIDTVFVQDKYETGIKMDEITELQIADQCQLKVKETLQQFVAYGDNQLTPIIGIAENIVSDVLKQSEIMYNVCGIREKSDSMFAHSLNVCALSVFIAIRMKMSQDKIHDIAVGSLLHDIGITYYKNNYSHTSYNDLTPEQYLEYKKHVIYGYSLLEHEDWLSPLAKDIVLSHHERMDGSGYPFGISGKRVKKATRIVAICDAFDSLVYGNMCNRLKVYEAIEYIISEADHKYDLAIVKVFHDSVAAYPTGSIVRTNRGDKAIVLGQNRKCPTRPILRLLENSAGVEYKEWVEQDLTKELTLFIEDTDL